MRAKDVNKVLRKIYERDVRSFELGNIKISQEYLLDIVDFVNSKKKGCLTAENDSTGILWIKMTEGYKSEIDNFLNSGGFKWYHLSFTKKNIITWLPHALSLGSLVVAFLSYCHSQDVQYDVRENKQKLILLERKMEMHTSEKALHKMNCPDSCSSN